MTDVKQEASGAKMIARWCVVVLVVVICIASFLYVREQIARERAEMDRLLALNDLTLEKVIDDVDRAYKALGRAPVDQAELEMTLGEELPSIYAVRTPMPIRYFRKNENAYYLVYLSARGYRRFDSDLRESGWSEARTD